ncbi:MAG: mannose-1-phosphate guanylyltransferase [Bacteroidetes bacterium]|nr:MAG: mannose-1-phosphate guanylyltransferase [Bacteroidota bacterium]
MNKNRYCVIMAGGVGSRFWPMSRTAHPKQFIDVLGTGRTLLQQTYDRALRLCPPGNIYVVTNDTYVSLVREQLPELPVANIVSEPARKNTAPCIAYAAWKIHRKNPAAVMLVAPSDHLISKEDTYHKAIRSCFTKASGEDCLLTIGIKPTRPDTGYGYIQFIEPQKTEKDKRIKKVKTFAEKPELDQAKFFLQSGDFLWNAGIFVWSTQSLLKAFELHQPEMAAIFEEGKDLYNTSGEAEFIRDAYSRVKNISIDYAVMEKATNVYVRSSLIGWSDLGTWGSLYTHIKKDDHQNATVGKNVMLYNSSNCIVHVPKDKLVVIEGLDGYIVVESDNILLICKKQDEQMIRNFVNDVKISKGEKYV